MVSLLSESGSSIGGSERGQIGEGMGDVGAGGGGRSGGGCADVGDGLSEGEGGEGDRGSVEEDGRGRVEEEEAPVAARASAMEFQCASGVVELVCALVQWKEIGMVEGIDLRIV